MSRRSDMHGLTLIEFMVTIAVLAVFISIAVPSFGRLIENNRVTAAANEFHALLNSARSDAVTRRTSIVVTQSGAVWSSDNRSMEIPSRSEERRVGKGRR